MSTFRERAEAAMKRRQPEYTQHLIRVPIGHQFWPPGTLAKVMAAPLVRRPHDLQREMKR